jgi:DNA-binding PadR family transcriptional regulator
MPRRAVSNLLALAVLSCLIERPMHPYEMSTTLRTRGKEQSIKLNYGSLYSVVENLAKHGLIEAVETVREGRRPERTVYAITDAGRTEFEDWMAELLSTPVREYTSLEAALSLVAGISPDEAARLLAERAERLELEIAGLDATLSFTSERRMPELFVVETEYRRAVLDAERGFVRRLAERIRTDDLGGTRWWRRIHELAAQGVTLQEIFDDPVEHLGEEAAEIAPFLTSNP